MVVTQKPRSVMPLNGAGWRFPARNGGIDYVNDPSGAHFSDAPIPKLVREVIQNSLDAKQSGLAGPVAVTFSETRVGTDLIGGTELGRHLQSCLDRATDDNRSDAAEVYANALAVLKQPTIPCLKVQDTGTTGLNDPRWKALVVQEGAVSKGKGAPGGSFGIGKNAILNVSDLQTVFYSTRLVEGRKGRVEKLQGKATLTGHLDPNRPSVDLQHIGFYSHNDGGPLMGTSIPEFFRLDDSGTGVFVMGFNPHSSVWVEQLVTSVIENFFYAIHHQRLTVEVSTTSAGHSRIDHQTIDYLFNRLSPINRDAVHYYRAIRDLGRDDVEHTKQFEGLGGLATHVVFKTGAPRRIAHVNRNGMLITDSREQKSNPLAPRGRSLWPDFVGVVVPDTDTGDLWLRRMENPSHNSLSSGQLLNEEERREAETLLRQARQALRDVIERKAEVDRYGDVSNVDELSGILPDGDDTSGAKMLATKVLESQAPRFDVGEVEDSEPDEGEEPEDDHGGSEAVGGDKGRRGHGKNRATSTTLSERGPALQRVRYIPLSPSEAIIAFNPGSDPPREVRISLMPAGADRDPHRFKPVAIVEATRVGDGMSPLSVDDGEITFTPDSTERVTIKVVADGNLDRQAFRLK